MARERGRAGRAARRGLVRRRARSARARRRRAAHRRARRATCRAPRSARSSRRCSSRCSASGSRPARTRSSSTRADAARARGATQCRPEVEGAANPARELARQIGRTIPLIYGGGALGAVAAYRWKCDVNENAKAPAFWNAVPRARPQRDLRVGPARRRHPPADHARRAAARLRARRGCGCASTRRARSSTSACTRCCRSRPRARAGSRSCSTSCTWATGRAATSRCRTTSIPARSTRSSS